MRNILVIAAHPDDEVLGAGGTILKHVAAGDRVDILILGEGESSRGDLADAEKRARQAQEAARALGAKELILERFPDQKFDTVPLLDLAKKIEAAVARLQPEIVFTHCPGDLNQDHRAVFQATMIALRPLSAGSVKRILAFEIPSSTEWQAKIPTSVFCPNFYVEISEFVDRKAEILGIYKDEIRLYPHPRSREGVKIFSQFRGLESGCAGAEAFQLIRQIV